MPTAKPTYFEPLPGGPLRVSERAAVPTHALALGVGHYEGLCRCCKMKHELASDSRVWPLAEKLKAEFRDSGALTEEGKMYGVLLGEDRRGQLGWLKAFSGSINGSAEHPGWVPPAIQHQVLAQREAETIAILDQLSVEIAAVEARLKPLKESTLPQIYARERKELKAVHHARRLERKAKRETGLDAKALGQLDAESRMDSGRWRAFVKEEQAALDPLKVQIKRLEERRIDLRRTRRDASRRLQKAMHDVHSLRALDGTTMPLEAAFTGSGSMPTGTGDCCAPKLLQFCALNEIKPLGMVEFWWGPTSSDGSKQQGKYYPSCVEKCQPIMGALLCSASGSLRPQAAHELRVLYEDRDIAIIDKPHGLLSVPGRGSHKYDCIQHRAKHRFPQANGPLIVHRLDLETSGLMVIALTSEAHRHLSKQFAQRKISKRYIAILEGPVQEDEGQIELAFRFDPENRPRQTFDPIKGKLGITTYQVLERTASHTRIEFRPLTGRTHQLRVHAAHAQGLGTPILGDQLYGTPSENVRLHLHAAYLAFEHPGSQRRVEFECPAPF